MASDSSSSSSSSDLCNERTHKVPDDDLYLSLSLSPRREKPIKMEAAKRLFWALCRTSDLCRLSFFLARGRLPNQDFFRSRSSFSGCRCLEAGKGWHLKFIAGYSTPVFLEGEQTFNEIMLKTIEQPASYCSRILTFLWLLLQVYSQAFPVLYQI